MSHLFDFCFRVFQRGVSVEEFWDTKSQIMGESGLGLLLGISGSEGAKVYHIWDGANVSRRSITNGGVPGDFGVPAPYPPIYFAIRRREILLYHGLLSYDQPDIFSLEAG